MIDSATDLADRIRRRDVSAVEVLDAFLDRIDRGNGRINAFITIDGDRARRRAAEADRALAAGTVWGPLHGVPFTVKDAISTADLPTTSGFPPLAEYQPSEDAPVVARLRAAGAILIGKTNLPPLAGEMFTDNPIAGRTNNPRDLNHTAGGSSGGGAAAVAAQFTPFDIASDAGGSLRVPAHFCGVRTIKPTDGRVPISGHIPPLPPLSAPQANRHGVVIGPIAASVADLDLLLRIIAGPHPSHPAVPPVPYDLAVPDRPRIAWTVDFGGLPVTAATRAAVRSAADRLADSGCEVEERPLPIEMVSVWETFGELWQSELGTTMPPEQEARECADLDPDEEDPYRRGRARRIGASARDYLATLAARDAIITTLDRFFARWDGFLCPVMGRHAFRHEAAHQPIDIQGQQVPYALGTGAYCVPFTLSGQPAAVVPVGESDDGLPIGVQIAGPRWHDRTVLAIAGRLSR